DTRMCARQAVAPRHRTFFFSSRRRHTRFSRDWSSDVCSSDLHYSTAEIAALMPFVPPEQLNAGADLGTVFNRSEWLAAQEKVSELYMNSGYLYSRVVAQEARRTGPDSQPRVDLRLVIEEGAPAYVNRVYIVGNDVTHERVIREAIIILPGELFNRQRLIQSWNNISTLNYFEQPMAIPDIAPQANGDVDI